MELTYQGDSCMRLRGKEVYVFLDPPAKGGPKTQADNIVVRTEGETDSTALRPHGEEPQLVAGPGEFEVRGVAIQGLAIDRHTVMRVEVDDVRVVTVGRLQRQLTDTEIESLGHVDVLCIPMGGEGTLSPTDATKLARAIEPAIVVPMQASTSGDAVGMFAKEMGVAEGWTAQPKLNLTGSITSHEETRVVILESRN